MALLNPTVIGTALRAKSAQRAVGGFGVQTIAQDIGKQNKVRQL